MIRKLFFLTILLFFTTSMYSQKILMDVSKYDLDKIERRVIKKTRKLLKTDRDRNLSVFTYFAVGLSDYFFQETGTVDDFLKNFRLLDKYRCYVYDNSLNIITMAIETTVFHYANTTPDNKYIEYITKLNPEYIFEYIYYSGIGQMYFCYKNEEIIIVHLSDDGKNIVSCPLLELKDWKWLNYALQ